MPRAPWWPPTRASSSRTTGHGSSSAAGWGWGTPLPAVCVLAAEGSAWGPSVLGSPFRCGRRLSLPWALVQDLAASRCPGASPAASPGAVHFRARLRVRLRRALSLGRPRCGFSMRPVSHVVCGPDSSRCWGCGLHPLDQGHVGRRGAGGSPLRSHSVPPRVWITTVLQKML